VTSKLDGQMHEAEPKLRASMWQQRTPAHIPLGLEPRVTTAQASGLDLMKIIKILPSIGIEHEHSYYVTDSASNNQLRGTEWVTFSINSNPCGARRLVTVHTKACRRDLHVTEPVSPIHVVTLILVSCILILSPWLHECPFARPCRSSGG
jgi:hypothetical protein